MFSNLNDVEMLTFMPQKLIKLLTVVMWTVRIDTVRSSGKACDSINFIDMEENIYWLTHTSYS